jgi:hypothetical protein
MPDRPSSGSRWLWPTVAIVALILWGCGDDSGDVSESTITSTTATVGEELAEPLVEVTADSFRNLNDMTRVRGFFMDNLAGDLDATLAAAESTEGGTYPVGTLVQLFPGEAMVKQPEGFSPGTGDWEFFELDVDEDGTTIRVRGGVEVINRFGGSCADCHAQADARFDFVCEQDHGCEPLPIERTAIDLLQDTDPRPRT